MSGTWFAPIQISNETLVRLLLQTLLSPPVDGHTDDELQSMINEILLLYPDDPALGTPFGTGSGTFDLSTTASRVSTICGPSADNCCSTPVLIHFVVGDVIVPLGAPVSSAARARSAHRRMATSLRIPAVGGHGSQIRWYVHTSRSGA